MNALLASSKRQWKSSRRKDPRVPMRGAARHEVRRCKPLDHPKKLGVGDVYPKSTCFLTEEMEGLRALSTLARHLLFTLGEEDESGAWIHDSAGALDFTSRDGSR